jgi:hypothetical protein
VFGTKKHRAHVHRKRRIPLVDGLFSNRAERTTDASIVEHHVDTTEPVDGETDERFDIDFGRHIDFKELKAIPDVEISKERCTSVTIEIASNDRPSFSEEPFDGSSTDPAAASRHYRRWSLFTIMSSHGDSLVARPGPS